MRNLKNPIMILVILAIAIALILAGTRYEASKIYPEVKSDPGTKLDYVQIDIAAAKSIPKQIIGFIDRHPGITIIQIMKIEVYGESAFYGDTGIWQDQKQWITGYIIIILYKENE